MPERFRARIEQEPSREINILQLRPIRVGVEGPKYIAEVESPDTKKPYTVFVKSMYERKDALQQQRQYEDLKRLGVNVPGYAWAHEFDNGAQALVATDLSENGKNFVLCCNNPELKTAEGKQLIKSISPDTKRAIQDHLIFSAIQVSGLGEITIDRKYSLSNNTMALVIEKQNPDVARPVAVDYGVDLHEPTPNQTSQDLLRSGLYGVGCFYAIVVGEQLELPDNPVFNSIDREALKKYCRETTEFFWHKK